MFLFEITTPRVLGLASLVLLSVEPACVGASNRADPDIAALSLLVAIGLGCLMLASPNVAASGESR